MSSLIDNLNDFMIWNKNQRKSEVSTNEKNITVNGIIWNAYDTYRSVVFNKKLILNSKSKASIDRQDIVKKLERKGLNKQLFETILFDLFHGGGAGITTYEVDYIEYKSFYKPIDWNLCSFEYQKSKTLEINKKGEVLFNKNIISGSYFLITKDYDNFGNHYSILDKCYTQLLTYNKISAYNLNKTAKNFEREMFYQISSDTLQKMSDTDSEVDIQSKNEKNKEIFANIKERITTLFKSKGNTPRIIQSAIKPVFVDTEIELDKLVRFKESIIKEIALCCNVPASSLGISNSANKAQSETDKDNLTNQATVYTNIFVECANYWLHQFYPDYAEDLYFTWQENETDETLQIREQNQKVFEFYTANAASLSSLGIDVDVNKLVELANSVSIPDLFKITDQKNVVDNNQSIVDVQAVTSPFHDELYSDLDKFRSDPMFKDNLNAISWQELLHIFREPEKAINYYSISDIITTKNNVEERFVITDINKKELKIQVDIKNKPTWINVKDVRLLTDHEGFCYDKDGVFDHKVCTRAVDTEELDDVYSRYKEVTNLSYSELKTWSDTDTSKLASLTRDPINRNLELLNTKKENWTEKHISWANKTISFVSRMKNGEQGEEIKNTGWTARDISLMNWAYNPKKTQRRENTNFENLKIKPIYINDWENNQSVQDDKAKIEAKLKKYIQTQVDITKRSRADFEADMPKEEFRRYVTNLSKGVVDLYNERNVSQYEIFDTILDNIDKVVNLTYDGEKDYLGIWKTIDDKVVNNASFDLIFKQIKSNLESSLYIPLFNETTQKLAVKDDAQYIGTIAKNDSLVRPNHLSGSGKIWSVSDPAYWLEPNCRCNRVYGTVQELLEAGFSNPKNY
jgi:hypothetical protein